MFCCFYVMQDWQEREHVCFHHSSSCTLQVSKSWTSRLQGLLHSSTSFHLHTYINMCIHNSSLRTAQLSGAISRSGWFAHPYLELADVLTLSHYSRHDMTFISCQYCVHKIGQEKKSSYWMTMLDTDFNTVCSFTGSHCTGNQTDYFVAQKRKQ